MTPRRRFLFCPVLFLVLRRDRRIHAVCVGRWVTSLGHGGYVVGAMLGLWYASRIIAPPAWAALTARSERPGMWLVPWQRTRADDVLPASR